MIRLVLGRLGRSILLLFFLSIFVFLLSRAMPGDILTDLQLDPSFSGTSVEELRAEYGLNQSLAVQYVRWLQGIFLGDFGYSAVERQKVSTLIWPRLWRTLVLASATMLLSLSVTLLVAGWRLRKRQDWITGLAIPLILALPIAVTCLALNWVRITSGLVYYYEMSSTFSLFTQIAWPGLALAIPVTAYFIKFLGREVDSILQSQYFAAAEAKGLHRRHALRQVLAPVAPSFVQVLGVVFSSLLAGAIIAETVFDFPGLGVLTWNAALNRDTFLLIATVLVGCSFVLVINMATDMLVFWLDPRLRSRTR